MAARFRIYYGDGTRWDSAVDGAWASAPKNNVQVIMIHRGGPRNDYQEIIQGDDVFRVPELDSGSKNGRQMTDAAYSALVQRAVTDLNWG